MKRRRVHHAARWRGVHMAAYGARAAAVDAGGRLSWKSYGARPTRAAICLRCSRTVKAAIESDSGIAETHAECWPSETAVTI